MQRRTRIKICGITQVEQAMQAVDAGADAIGLVFYEPSKRYVDRKTAYTIRRALPAFVTCVGLFVDAESATVRRLMSELALDCLQFHGNESVADCEQYGFPYIKAIRVRQQQDIMQADAAFSSAQGLLLDSYHEQHKGGSGTTFDWSLIPKQNRLPIILAGGLNVQNVREAVHTVRPYALDVSSGVESAPGIKEKELINQFVTEVGHDNRV